VVASHLLLVHAWFLEQGQHLSCLEGGWKPADECSTVAGNTSTGDGLSCIVVSTFRTLAAMVGNSWDSARPVCLQPQNAGSLDWCGLVSEKLVEAAGQHMALTVGVDWSMAAMQHVAYRLQSCRWIASDVVEMLSDGIVPRSRDGISSCLSCC